MRHDNVTTCLAAAGLLLGSTSIGVAGVLEVPAYGSFTLAPGEYTYERVELGIGAQLEITGDVKLILQGPPDPYGVVLRLGERSKIFGTPTKGANGANGIAGTRGQDGPHGQTPGNNGASGTNGTGGAAGSSGDAGRSGFKLIIEASGRAVLAGDIVLPGGDGGIGGAGGPGGGGGSRYLVRRSALERAQRKRKVGGHSGPGFPEGPAVGDTAAAAEVVALAIVFGGFDGRLGGRDADFAGCRAGGDEDASAALDAGVLDDHGREGLGAHVVDQVGAE